jgi:hypothetical protein
MANGGRSERFLIRLPADRLVAGGSAGMGIRGQAYPSGLAMSEPASDRPFLLEHYKLRDADGKVIGLAIRHWTTTPGDKAAAAWCLVLPGRGALFLDAQTDSADRVDAALRRAGYSGASPWSGSLEVQPASNGAGEGRVVAGTGEFAGLQGRYAETWSLTGANPSGGLRGTIELSTITYEGE